MMCQRSAGRQGSCPSRTLGGCGCGDFDGRVHLVDAAAEDRLRNPPPRMPPVALGDLREDFPRLGLGQDARDSLYRLTLDLAERTGLLDGHVRGVVNALGLP